MDKDEKFTMPPERVDIFIRKGGIYRNETGGGIKIAFKIDTTDHVLQGQTGHNFEALSDEVIKKAVATIHTENRCDCLLYEWNSVEFEQVDSVEQDWFNCA
jgi:hypothetical protein